MKLLIIGCGSIGSRHARNAQVLGHSVVPCDPDPARGQYLDYKTALRQEQVDAAKKIVPGDIRQIPDLKSYFAESGETFDMITMNDVLEHLDKKEILETLKMVRTSLNPSGVFICRVPNMSNIFGVYLFYNDFTHEAAFTEYSIGQVLGLAGFEDINVYGNVTHINSSWKRALFNIAAKIIAAMTKLILAYIYMPGSRQPSIMTTFLIATGKNINKERI